MYWSLHSFFHKNYNQHFIPDSDFSFRSGWWIHWYAHNEIKSSARLPVIWFETLHYITDFQWRNIICSNRLLWFIWSKWIFCHWSDLQDLTGPAWLQWCCWQRYVGDFIMVTVFRYLWQYHSVGDLFNVINRSPISQSCHQHISSPTSVTNINVTARPVFWSSVSAVCFRKWFHYKPILWNWPLLRPNPTDWIIKNSRTLVYHWRTFDMFRTRVCHPEV